jgi:hypothetical protein
MAHRPSIRMMQVTVPCSAEHLQPSVRKVVKVTSSKGTADAIASRTRLKPIMKGCRKCECKESSRSMYLRNPCSFSHGQHGCVVFSCCMSRLNCGQAASTERQTNAAAPQDQPLTARRRFPSKTANSIRYCLCPPAGARPVGSPSMRPRSHPSSRSQKSTWRSCHSPAPPPVRNSSMAQTRHAAALCTQPETTYVRHESCRLCTVSSDYNSARFMQRARNVKRNSLEQ